MLTPVINAWVEKLSQEPSAIILKLLDILGFKETIALYEGNKESIVNSQEVVPPSTDKTSPIS